MADSINNLAFQPLSQENLDSILDIENDVQHSPWSAQNFISCFTDTLYLSTGLFARRQLLGYCIMQVNVPDAEIHNFAIDRAFQNQGMGHLLLSHMTNICAEHHIEQVFLEVRQSNHVAINLYRKAGFVEVGCRQDYYRTDSITESALIFELKPDSK